MIALTLLEPADPGTCADCQADTSRSVYGRMAVCDRCALQRIKIVRRNRDR
jgi:predicted amidophosphoribosyltransferase